MKPEVTTLPHTEAGLALALHRTTSLRRAGFKTRLIETHILKFRVYRLTATPAPRPNRTARGCNIRREP